MKSIENGTGFSTTSKKIIVYKKKCYPIRFYDVKGIENEKTLENYDKIMRYFNINNNISNESLNAIFYCIEYKGTGTIIEKMDYRIFKELIQFDVPIIFIITKTPYDTRKSSTSQNIEIKRKVRREQIENAINQLIISSFESNNRENNAQKFINTYTQIFYVNLVRMENEIPVPVFGIDKVLSYLSELVPEQNWVDLKKACDNRNEKECKELHKNNVPSKYYSEFENLKKINQEVAKDYLNRLNAGAFFSGMIPGLDIGLEYYYKYLFKQKLKSLYSFDYDKAIYELNIKNNSIEKKIQR